MALSLAFDIARRALIANETALGVIGNNIANANTPGYTRQVPRMVQDRATLTADGQIAGRGVHLASIDQILDPLVAQRLVRAQSDRAGFGAREDALQKLSRASSDLEEPSLAGAVDQFFDALDGLARNPAGLGERENVLGRARGLAFELNRRSASSAQLQRVVDDRFVQLAGQANGSLARIAQLNREIAAREAGGANANELRDERTRALSDLAEKIGVRYQEDETGAVRVTASNGVTLVELGTVVHGVAVQPGGAGLDGQPLHQLAIDGPAGPLVIPSAFAEGELGALAEVRDGDLVTASTRLDALAQSLRDRVNAVQTAGYDLDGAATTTQPLFAGTGAATFAVALADPRTLAAASTTDPANGANALALADLRTTTFAELAGMTFGGWLAAEQGRIAEDAALASDAASASRLVATQLESERSALSGVNLDEELTNLLRYQRAYQAVAQVLNVANGTFDELLKFI